jgi:hypothetical protein
VPPAPITAMRGSIRIGSSTHKLIDSSGGIRRRASIRVCLACFL